MEQEVIAAAEQLMSSNLWKVAVIFIISFITIGLIKHIASTLFEFIMIKTDIFGVGSTIHYAGKKAIIKHIGVRRIELYMMATDESIFIRTADWKKFDLVVPNHIKKEQ